MPSSGDLYPSQEVVETRIYVYFQLRVAPFGFHGTLRLVATGRPFVLSAGLPYLSKALPRNTSKRLHKSASVYRDCGVAR